MGSGFISVGAFQEEGASLAGGANFIGELCSAEGACSAGEACTAEGVCLVEGASKINVASLSTRVKSRHLNSNFTFVNRNFSSRRASRIRLRPWFT